MKRLINKSTNLYSFDGLDAHDGLVRGDIVVCVEFGESIMGACIKHAIKIFDVQTLALIDNGSHFGLAIGHCIVVGRDYVLAIESS